MNKLLLIDDEADVQYSFRRIFDSPEIELATASSGEEGLKLIPKFKPDLVLMDIRMGGMSGLETLRRLRQTDSKLLVILMTAYGTTQMAIEAMKLGAYDYLLKPFDVPKLKEIVHNALKAARDMRQVVSYQPLLESEDYELGIVGRSEGMQRVFKLIGQLAASDATALITGESGTGKELVARAIYHHSARSAQPFLAVNCAALTGPQLESELFGHLKGAIPGTEAHKEGLFEAAKGGTLFLDEIGAMPLETQEKLLRVLQDREVRRLNSNQGIPINVRVLAATSDDLQARIRKGHFREDLFNRLGAISIEIAPLRKRPEDILPIANSLLRKAYAAGEKAPRLSRETCSILEAYEWPGNVRELDDCIKHVLSLGPREEIAPDDLPPQIRSASPKPPVSGPASVSIPGLEHAVSLKAFLHRKEKEYLEQALKRVDGDKKAAAQNLNISVADLQRKLSDSKEG